MNQSNTTAITPIVSVYAGFSWSGYVRISLSLFGFFFNTINIFAFLSSILKDTSYKYMLAKSVASWIYLALTLTTEFIAYCVNCDWSLSYLSKFWTIAIGVYFLSCLAFFRILIDITLSLYTYLILVNKTWTKKYIYLVILVGEFVFSILFNLQKPFTYSVIQAPGQSGFANAFTQFGQSDFNKILNIFQSLFKIFLAVILLAIINMANLILFRRRFNDRVIGTVSNLTNQTSSFFLILKIIDRIYLNYIFFFFS